METLLFNNRIIIALIVTLIIVLLLVMRLVSLQIIDHEHFITLSKNNRVKIVPLAPTRGLIYDRNGVLLADNLPAFSLDIVQEQVEDLDKTISELRQIIEISDADIERFRKLSGRKRRFENVPLRLRLNETEVARFVVNRHRFKGVDIQARLIRHYPKSSLAVHAIGYVGRINDRELAQLESSNYLATTHIGKVGVEKSYEGILHGTVGYQQVETNAEGRLLRVLDRTLPVPGKNIYLSIDSRVQAAAEKALADQRGAVVAMDPRTGDILALVSTPGFDPNPFVLGIGTESYRSLQNSPDKPLFNRALKGQYPPGSTLKPFIGLGGMGKHVITRDGAHCYGWYTLPNDDRKYRDWKREGHGHMDLRSAIAQSCDVYFYDLALRMGIDRLYETLNPFGFGKKTGIDIFGEKPGLLPSREWKKQTRNLPGYPGETLITGIGQGFTLVTPLQLVYATTIIANRGIPVRPRAVLSLEDTSTNVLYPVAPRKYEKLNHYQARHWDFMNSAMIDVVHGMHGTARSIGIDATYKIAGKTGTAQVFSIAEDEKYEASKLASRLHDHSLFIGYAPVDEPRIVIATVVENAGSGSAVAAPVTRKIMDSYLLGPQL
jgi:penicillin-binding protein 2